MFLEILQITIPAVLVMATAVFMMNRNAQKDHERKMTELALSNNKTITPIRLQAYERITVFLERITPNSIIFRLQTPKMTAGNLHSEMLELIRAEYEHNLSQQIYETAKAKGLGKKDISSVITMLEEMCDVEVRS